MMDPINGGTIAGEPTRGLRRWGLRRARTGVIAGSIAPALPAPDAAGTQAEGAVAGEPALPQVRIVSVRDVAAALEGGERRRRLRWVGWISRRVFHAPADSRFT